MLAESLVEKYVQHTLRYQNKPKEESDGIKLSSSSTPENIIVNIINDSLDCDPPPFSSAWVGRETELGIIKDPTIKVFAITGIGGQGKSTLASKVIEELETNSSNPTYWDWRDCREVGDTFQTQLIMMIERFTNGETTARAFVGIEIVKVINYFFDIIKNIHGYFILDNIDHYIDVETKKPINVLKLFVDAALSRNHKSKIILTCRPSLQYDNQCFFEISLPGLSIEETQKLFIQSKFGSTKRWWKG